MWARCKHGVPSRIRVLLVVTYDNSTVRDCDCVIITHVLESDWESDCDCDCDGDDAGDGGGVYDKPTLIVTLT